jgi:hypothetical protein
MNAICEKISALFQNKTLLYFQKLNVQFFGFLVFWPLTANPKNVNLKNFSTHFNIYFHRLYAALSDQTTFYFWGALTAISLICL